MKITKSFILLTFCFLSATTVAQDDSRRVHRSDAPLNKGGRGDCPDPPRIESVVAGGYVNIYLRPLRCWDLADSAGIVCSKAGLDVSVCASYAPMGGSETPKGTLAGGVFDDNDRQTNTEWPLLLTVTGDNTTWTKTTDTITLKVLSFNGPPEAEGMEDIFPWLELKSTDVTVYLPDLTFASGGETYKFWVAEDGSTFNATSGGTPEDTVNQSANLAMEYDSTGPAACAYDIRFANAAGDVMQKWLVAKSPAVNAGTEDGYDYDSTSTRDTKIDQGKPDVGYHYYRRVSDDDPLMVGSQKFVVSFAAPQEKIRKTSGYRAKAGQQEVPIAGDWTTERLQRNVQFPVPLSVGTNQIRLITVADGATVSSDGDPINVFVDPYAPMETDFGVRVSMEGREGLWCWKEDTKTFYYNGNMENIDSIKLEVAIEQEKKPWKIDFKGRENRPAEEDEWRHFGDYEVFPTPTE